MKVIYTKIVLILIFAAPAQLIAQTKIVELKAKRFDHVVLISIDGLMRSAVSPEKMPFAAQQKLTQLWVPTVESVMRSVTVVNHTSMVSGLDSKTHGVESNKPHLGLSFHRKTMFDYAKMANLKTAMIINKEKLSLLARPGTLDVFSLFKGKTKKLVKDVRRTLKFHRPNLLFIHFALVDKAGHGFGWGSAQYDKAVKQADDSLKKIDKAIRKLFKGKKVALIVTSDHGGHSTTHGTEMKEDVEIPWLLISYHAKKPQVVTQGKLKTFNTAAVVIHLLGLDVKPDWEAKSFIKY